MNTFKKVRRMTDKLRNPEMLDSSQYVNKCTLETQAPVQDQDFMQWIGALDQETQAALMAFNRDNRLSFSEEKDGARDTPFVCSVKLIEVYTGSKKPVVKQAAESLMGIVERYRGTAELPIDEESTAIRSYLEEMSRSENEVHVKNLPELEDFLTDLKTAQTDFEQQRHAFEHELTERKADGGTSTSSYRKRIYHLINDVILPYIELKAALVGGEWQQLADRLDLHFTRLAAQVKARKNSGKGKPQGSDEPGQEQPQGSGVNPDEGGDAVVPDKPGQGGSDGSDDESRPMV